jgi:hypothetical protein
MKLLKLSGVLPLLCVFLVSCGLVAGCGDDDSTSPKPVTLDDFEGYWEMTTYRITNAANTSEFVEIVGLGADLAMQVDDSGNFTGEAFVPSALTGGAAVKFPFAGFFTMVGQDSIRMDFTPDIEPFLTDATTAFQLSGNTLTLSGDTMTFDFDLDGEEEAALFDATVLRGIRVIDIDDFVGYWEAAEYHITNASNPAETIETVSMGATFGWTVDDQGNFTGDMHLPGALVGQAEDIDIQFQGYFNLVGQDSVYAIFTPEVPPFLTNTSADYTLWGGVLVMTDRTTLFDFDGDQVPEPAIFEGTMVWSDPIP